MSKKEFTLTNEQAEFLYAILNNQKLCPLPDLVSMRKVGHMFDAIEETVDGYQKNKERIRENAPDGTLTISQVEQVRSQLKKVADTSKPYACDKEAFTFVQQLFEKAVEKAYQGENAIGGRENSRLFVSVVEALDRAQLKEK